MPLIEYFTDPLMRGPVLGSMFMCVTAAIIGTITVLRRRALLGESLSHAAYPGVLLAASLVVAYVRLPSEWLFNLALIAGAMAFSYLGYRLLLTLERLKIHSDTALCFTLSSFFGLGLLLASRLQFTSPQGYQMSQVYLYGQTATLSDQDIWMFATLTGAVLLVFSLFFKEIQVISFDSEFAGSLGKRMKYADAIFTALLICSIVIGLRSVGVVLMSAMLIIPFVVARQFCNRLLPLIVLAAVVGALSGLLGTILSVESSLWLGQRYQLHITLPTGPAIVLLGTVLCLIALLAAPQRGLITRATRSMLFRWQCAKENLLKQVWREDRSMTIQQLAITLGIRYSSAWLLCHQMARNGWLLINQRQVTLTKEGQRRAAQLVRLHRLWELYLVDCLGLGVERVHRSAEEIEHILTPELEAQLESLLENPVYDPHNQPIPPKQTF